uniref:Uncharacterized protein n=1 Tax=Glossina brevipalpis TaxID=37001 RepID=A0A1A9WU61_9MUSC
MNELSFNHVRLILLPNRQHDAYMHEDACSWEHSNKKLHHWIYNRTCTGRLSPLKNLPSSISFVIEPRLLRLRVDVGILLIGRALSRKSANGFGLVSFSGCDSERRGSGLGILSLVPESSETDRICSGLGRSLNFSAGFFSSVATVNAVCCCCVSASAET